MDPDLEEPNVQPGSKQDLFMTPDLPPEIELPKPKRSKKFFIIIGVVGIIVVAIVTVALVSKKSTDVQETAQSTQVEVGQKEAAEFLKYIANKDTKSALLMYDEANRPEEKSFHDDIIVGYGKKVDFNSCAFQQDLGNVNNKSQTVFIFRCPLYKDPANKYIDFYLGFIKTSGGTVKLETFMVKEIKQ